MTILEHPGLILEPLEYLLRCALTVASGGSSNINTLSSFTSLVLRVLSSTLLPGFFGPESSVLPVNLPPPCTLPASGSPYRFSFIVPSAALQHQCSRASLGKTHHLPISRPASRQVGYSRYQALPSHAGSTSLPTPFSWFALRYVHRFCLMLPSDIHLWFCPCLVGVALPSGCGGLYYCLIL